MLIEADGHIYYYKYCELCKIIIRNFPNMPDMEFLDDVKKSNNFSKKFKKTFSRLFKDIYSKSTLYFNKYNFEGNKFLKKSIVDKFNIEFKNEIILKELRYTSRDQICSAEIIF